MNRRPYVYILAAVVAAVLGLGGCMAGDGKKEDEGKPAVVVLWHAHNAVAKSAFDDLVMEFNETVGMEQGIIVEPVGYGSGNELDDVLYASASHVIGSDPLPDIFASYPDSAHRLDGIVPLVHLDDYFSEEELDAYRPEFLKEGIWEGDGICRMIPVAKSTEILYLNETDWERFAGDTGADKEMLKTWEGLAQAAGMYYEWSGGSPFLGMNAFNDFASLTAAHYIGSSAGAGFFPQVVIEDEKQSHPIACGSYAYPVFQGGTSYMGQRGANMAVFSTDESHQQAAVRFLKWFTEPEQNIRFAVATGYLPVQEKTLESVSDPVAHVESRDNVQAVEKSIRTSFDALENHNVYVRETFQGSYDMDQIFSVSLENCMNADLETLKQRMEKGESRESVERELLDEEHFNRWYETLLKEMAGKTDGQKIQK